MQYRSLGRSGLKVSAAGLGTNQFGNKVEQVQTNAKASEWSLTPDDLKHIEEVLASAN